MDDGVTVPISASVLVARELDRRRRLGGRGKKVLTGCRGIDGYVLLGGFERGSVVGVSVEEDEVGLLIGLQTIARFLVSAVLANDGEGSLPRAMIITMAPVNVLLPKLRHILVNQVSALQNGLLQNVNRHVQRCLENISISRVFDVEGLQEVLGEIKATDSKTGDRLVQPVRVGSDRPLEAEVNTELEQPTEILDSQDEDEGTVHPDIPPPIREKSRDSTPPPDLILITHTTPLLNALFTGRDKTSAHETMASLSSQLHHLARAGPLIMLLNSTTASSTTGGPTSNQEQQQPRTAETTLRSIFAQLGVHAKNKPSFGLVFTRLLDLHLLCMRVPRGKGDGGAGGRGVGMSSSSSYGFAWVVEVLLDEMGVYDFGGGDGEGGEGRIRRRCRERRWGVVEVEEGGGRVVDG